jgi:DNA-binding response OmpR family regulator
MQIPRLIVLVDDDPDIRQIVHDRLTVAGYHVILTENAQRALQILAGIAADGLIVDFILPGMDGLELAKLVREQHASLPILMITGQTYPELTTKALVSGIREVISKPLNLQKLTTAAQKWFGPPDVMLRW